MCRCDTGSCGGYLREFAEDQAFHVGYGLASQLVDYYRNPDWYEDDDDN